MVTKTLKSVQTIKKAKFPASLSWRKRLLTNIHVFQEFDNTTPIIENKAVMNTNDKESAHNNLMNDNVCNDNNNNDNNEDWENNNNTNEECLQQWLQLNNQMVGYNNNMSNQKEEDKAEVNNVGQTDIDISKLKYNDNNFLNQHDDEEV